MLGKLLASISLVLVFCFLPFVPVLKWGSIDHTVWHREKGEMLVEKKPGNENWIPLENVSHHLLAAVLVSEDARFYDHHGLDFQEIWQSLRVNWKEGRYARGGSTITQQVVRIALLGREKTLLRKLREAVGALVLELLLSKQDILEWYINLADFGQGTLDLRDACDLYFDSKPELLTVTQSIHLASVLPQPNIRSKVLLQKSLSQHEQKRFAFLAQELWRGGHISKVQWDRSLATGNFGSPIESKQ